MILVKYLPIVIEANFEKKAKPWSEMNAFFHGFCYLILKMANFYNISQMATLFFEYK